MTERRPVTLLFWIANSLNAIGCFFSITFFTKFHPLLPLVLPYLYFTIRLLLYKLWYQLGYHPLAERAYYDGYRGGIHLPVFTDTTDEYRRLRQQQSLKYQIIYNTYKIIYRTIYFGALLVAFAFLDSTVFTEDYHYPNSPLEQMLETFSHGNESIEKFLFLAIFLLIMLTTWGLYHLGRKLWQKHFYKRYPVKILLVERDEPIFSLAKEADSTIFS